MKTVLLVDDEERVLQGLQRQLRPLRNEWTVVIAVGGKAALESLEAKPADVIISDMRMPGMDGAELLGRCKTLYPSMIRMVLSGQMTEDAALRSIAVAHQTLTKPCDAETLRHVLRRTAELSDVLQNEAIRSTIGSMDSLPILPESYDLLTRALADESISTRSIVPIVERDPMLTAKVLQVVNSAVVGARSRVTDLGHAVSMIGIENLRGLVLHFAIVHGMKFERIPYGLNLEAFQRMATWTAGLARRIAPEDCRDAAFAAGLLKDAGQILLALRRPDDYESVSRACEERQVARHEIEAEVLGFTSAQMGAYLLGMWGLPHELLLAVNHHRDADAATLAAEPATRAVHAATSILEEMMPAWPGRGEALHLDAEALKNLTWSEQMEEWEDIARSIVEEEGAHV
jgi:HD-like signal output (HDOD) protein